MTRLPAILVLLGLLFALVVPVEGDDRRTGVISHMGSGYPDSYLALPIGRGHTVRICGPAACRTMTSNDVGPHQGIHPDRIADVSARVFEELCGVPASAGLCRGSWTLVDDTLPDELPQTDTAL
jgi:hypothetical protein